MSSIPVFADLHSITSNHFLVFSYRKVLWHWKFRSIFSNKFQITSCDSHIVSMTVTRKNSYFSSILSILILTLECLFVTANRNLIFKCSSIYIWIPFSIHMKASNNIEWIFLKNRLGWNHLWFREKDSISIHLINDSNQDFQLH